MSIIEKIYEVSKQQGVNFRKDTNFLELEEFYKKALESGIVKKPEYNLPPIDTIGTAFRTSTPQE